MYGHYNFAPKALKTLRTQACRFDLPLQTLLEGFEVSADDVSTARFSPVEVDDSLERAVVDSIDDTLLLDVALGDKLGDPVFDSASDPLSLELNVELVVEEVEMLVPIVPFVNAD